MAAVQPSNTPATTSSDHPTTPVSICNCGCAFATQFYTSRNGAVYGPAHDGHLKLRDSPVFLLSYQQHKMTQEEFDIIGAMSINEGNIDAVQSWDSEVVTAGAMQKTINSSGNGELPTQIAKFKTQNLAAYNELFSHCGWDVQGSGTSAKVTYTHQTLTSGNAITGSELKTLIRNGFDEAAYTSHHSSQHTPAPPNIPLASLLQATSDTRYISLQVDDFIERYHAVMAKVVPNTEGLTVSQVFYTKLGRATALDEDVNRPSHVVNDIKNAIHHIGHPVSTWPTNPAQRQIIELQVVEYYGLHRNMTHPVERFNNLKALLLNSN
jgi:hypothetical protein